MKYILSFLLFTGCTAAEKEITIFEDRVRGVVCYSRYSDTLSCVKLKN